MKIIKIISEHKHIDKKHPPRLGFKRVEAIIEMDGRIQTKHIDIPKQLWK